MDPVEQVLAQSRAGSANGATLGIDALKWGMERRDKLKQQSFSNSIAQAQLELQKSTAEIQQQQASLAMRVNRMRLEQMQSLNEAGGELAALELEMSADPNGFIGGKGFDQAKAIFQKHPDIWGTDAGQGFIKRMQTAIEGQRRLKQIEDARNSLIGSGMTQSSVTIPNESGGTTVFKKEPEAIPGMIPESQTLDGVRYVNPNSVGTYAPTDTMKNYKELQNARDKGNEEGVRIFEEKLGIRGMTEAQKQSTLYRSLVSDRNHVLQAIDKVMSNPDIKTEMQGPILGRLRHRLEDVNRELSTVDSNPPIANDQSSGRVKVKNKDGVVGTIPFDQLQKALDAGYIRVE